VAGDTGYGGRSTTKARCSTSWSSHDAALSQRGDCSESYRRNRIVRRSASPRTSSNLTLSLFVGNGCLRLTIGDCARTIGQRIPTSRFGGESENNSGSSHRDQPNGSCQSTPPSTTSSTFNAIFYPAASSRYFVPRRSLSGIRVGLLPDPDHDRILATVPVNVSMPSERLRPGLRREAVHPRGQREYRRERSFRTV